jgi:hypothetical protein
LVFFSVFTVLGTGSGCLFGPRWYGEFRDAGGRGGGRGGDSCACDED